LALGVEPGDQDSAVKSLAALKAELAQEKAAREKAQAENETLTRAVDDLKKSVDRFATQIPDLEEKIKHLDNKVLHGLNLEPTTKANESYKSQNSELRKKLETKLPISFAA
jgi:chromosome segregation ATPase